MRSVPLSPVRRGIIWWWSHASPYVSVNVTIDFRAAQAYLDQLEARVTVNALVAGAITRVLMEYPDANARVVGSRIVRFDGVGIAMPVNLLGHPGEKTSAGELSMTLLEDADTLNLVEIAERSREQVRAERQGQMNNPLLRRMVNIARLAPDAAFERALEGLHTAFQRKRFAQTMFRQLPVTTAMSNPGAGFGDAPGALFRAASISLPNKIIAVGTFFGLSAIQDEVMAIDGKAMVVPALPMLFVFDHRLIDGVRGGQLLRRLVEILGDPALVFGADGQERFRR